MKILLACLALVLAVQAHPNIDDLPEAARYVHPIVDFTPGKLDSRIVGGSFAAKGQLPYQASLLIDSSILCGGSLIARNWVLTAAHCATSTSRVQVILGGLNRNLNQAEDDRIVVMAKRVIPHPLYGLTSSLNYDILLLELESNVEMGRTIQALALAGDNTITYAGTTARVSGFGKTSDSEGASTLLKYVDVNVITNEECSKTFTLYPGNICTKDLTGTIGNSCSGDSGGPLLSLESGLQIGIVSFGSSAGCESGHPKGLTRVSYFIDWIRDTTGLPL